MQIVSDLLVDSHGAQRQIGVAPVGVRTILVLNPLRTERIMAFLPAGGSVAEMMVATGLDSQIPARVFLDDRFLSDAEREITRPNPGSILTIRVLPTGSRKADEILLQIAVAAAAAAAAYFGGPEIAALAENFVPLTTAQATTVTAIAQVAIKASVSALGSQLINSLIPPPKTPVPKQETTPHSYTVSGTANAAAPFSPIPKLYGQRRIFPQYAASPYSELVGFNQYLRMLFLLGYGPLDIAQIKIGDTAIEDYEEVEWELRSGNTLTRDGYRQYHPSGDGCYRFAGHNSAELSAEVIPSEIGSSQPALNSSFATRIAFFSRVTQLVHTGSFSVPGFSHSDGSAT